MLLLQVGEFESSKSAMKTLAPEFSALMIILRSTGPVISTRRSSRSFGMGATFHSLLADSSRLRKKVGKLAPVDILLHGSPPRQQFLPPRLESGRKFQQEGAGIRGENLGLDL